MALDLSPTDRFVSRHVGPDAPAIAAMLRALEVTSLDALIAQAVPPQIRTARPLALPGALSEHELLERVATIGAMNQVWKSYLGMGYSDTLTPPVVLRNVLENPGWYTQYTPYQAEIAQGRLEALLNFQTMICDLTGLPIANASLLDEGTAAAEAMALSRAMKHKSPARAFFVSELCHPQTVDVVRTRAAPLGIDVVVGDHRALDFAKTPVFGALVQYPATDGAILDYAGFVERAHANDALVTVAADLLSLALLQAPGEFGADVAVGSAQRFGVPLGYGGPHAAFFATRTEFARHLPGRLIGVSTDAHGNTALRMALQTREQHIRREKATSNICTAQVLLAVIAGMYGVWHGPKGLRAIAERVHALASALGAGLRRLGVEPVHALFFDTVRIDGPAERIDGWMRRAAERRINLRRYSPTSLTISLDEATSAADVGVLLEVFTERAPEFTVSELAASTAPALPAEARRTSAYLTHPVFNAHHSETEMLRYLRRLEAKDLSLTHSMIPLGSCTMKLNATAEMLPVTWPEFGRLHPFAPPEQAAGYRVIFDELERDLAEITGMAAVSLQPNAGSQGEYAGLLCIRAFHAQRGEGHRDVCLIPASAHGTNPASAAMAGYQVVVVKTDANGNIDVADLVAKADAHAARLAALMVTYPSTHGVFEEEIRHLCELVHSRGGQVYMDGANLNALVGLARPGEFGADVVHINLHKTFCIPHGGGGPGMGPIAVAAHLAPYLPGHWTFGAAGGTGRSSPASPDAESLWRSASARSPDAPASSSGGTGRSSPASPDAESRGRSASARSPDAPASSSIGVGAVSAAPWGSASILLISWAYIRMMGGEGLTHATRVAILSANYLARRLDDAFPVLYRGARGRVAHECILDLRPAKKDSGVEVEDVAKRLMDYGFHAPTVSFPVIGTLMIEPTESEPKAELDRFAEALLAIKREIDDVAKGRTDRADNPLKNAPHTAASVVATEWTHPYSREQAAFPTASVRASKFWPSVGRIDNVKGDRQLVCSCPPVADYEA